MKLLYILTFLLLVPVTSQAKDNDPIKTTPDTRIQTDQEAEEIRFIVDGNVVGVMTKDGLRVDGDLTGRSFLHENEAQTEEQPDGMDEVAK